MNHVSSTNQQSSTRDWYVPAALAVLLLALSRPALGAAITDEAAAAEIVRLRAELIDMQAADGTWA